MFPEIMGILNVTPDSFSDGGNFFNSQTAVEHALRMIDQGADIIDIGGESTRPGAAEVAIVDEISRVIPVIREIKKLRANARISIDTTKYDVAKASLDLGAEIINDISGLKFDSRLAELANEYDASLCIMHINGIPRTMQTNPVYTDVVSEVLDFLKSQVNLAFSMDVKKVIVDVGIGFGKTVEHNLALLKNINTFNIAGTSQLLGISRKSFIGKSFNIENPQDRDVHTALIHSILLKANIDIIRVHNVGLITDLKKIDEIFC